MVSAENPLEQWRSHRAAFSDDALIAIANKGLLRRAQKDLQTDDPLISLEGGDRFQIRVSDCTVTLPVSGPAQATCTCPATAICRHILTACLWLRAQLTEEEPEDAEREGRGESKGISELLDFTLEQLMQWAGKPTVRKALEFRDRASALEISEGNPAVIQFLDANITCRYFASTGLEGMICSCKARLPCHHRVAALLAYQQAHGVSVPTLNPAPAESSTTAATPADILPAAQQLLTETVAVGLLHLSENTQQRFVTLAVSALGADLPRLSLALRRIGDEISLSLQRNAAADESRLFLAIAQTYALCEALTQMPNPGRADLIGQHRSRYDAIGKLNLIGVGAYHWQSKSGYAGLTVIFWEPDAQQWCSWSEARPRFYNKSFDPIARYYQTGPWSGVDSPAQASQSRLLLSSARRNAQHRLSASRQSQALVMGPTRLEDLDFGPRLFRQWEPLHQYAVSAQVMGLREFNPLQQIVVVCPAHWASRQFDAVQQILTWSLIDEQDQELLLQVPFRPGETQRIQLLEQLDPEAARLWGIVGQIIPTEAGFVLYPISLLRHPEPGQSAIMNLSFADVKTPVMASVTAPAIRNESESWIEETPEPEPVWQTYSAPSRLIEQQIEDLIERLERLAEQGIHRLTEAARQNLRIQAQQFHTVGLTTLAATIERLGSESGSAGRCLLQLRYLGQLCREAIAQSRLDGGGL